MIQTIEIGRTYYSGVPWNPEHCRVTHLVGYADLPEQDQRLHDLLGRQHGYDPRAATYVGYYSRRERDRGGERWSMLTDDVFKATAYETVEDLVRARTDAEPKAWGGMLRCTLPGDR